ncbi:MAG: ornithine cyclodeaminase [Bacteroidaceae bacterium]|nr:ornithine cyclodeaminase [Bacteroidaceae bacterium]
MRIITENDIESLKISPKTCVQWVKEALLIKPECQLPAKVHVHPQGNDFITTMPCLLTPETATFGVKVVSRINGRKPALKSNIMLYDSVEGDMKAVIDANWITSMRTGAMATLAIRTLRKPDTKVYSLMGLGSIARATMTCMLHEFEEEHLQVRLLRYKDQAERFAEEYSNYANVTFTIVDTIEEWATDSDVIISAITDAQGLIVEDLNLFKPGVLVVPVHMRGFQNCDRVFDKVFGDDYGHICGFKYFSEFKSFNEIGDVLMGKAEGRMNNQERILSYNYGLGLHDVYYAMKIMEKLMA